jgi:epoxyqueuosine reductase
MPSILNQSDRVSQLRQWAFDLGFVNLGIASPKIPGAKEGLAAWTTANHHGDMHYMAVNQALRADPMELRPGTQSVITVMLPYLPATDGGDWVDTAWSAIDNTKDGYVSLYARGRDYHKVMRGRLKQLAATIAKAWGDSNARVFVDSAPVLEVELAALSGLGWRGKHTLLLSREQGSMFFLGEIFVDLALPPTEVLSAHCGSCTRCIDVCPTKAIVAPYRLDARRCISYLTIENKGEIPLEMRPAIGNRIYGCDDCQLICPWNKYAQKSLLDDFQPRKGLGGRPLSEMMGWSQEQFEAYTEGTAIRRIGFELWQRNLAVACGNALADIQLNVQERSDLRAVLVHQRKGASALVAEHMDWALAREGIPGESRFVRQNRPPVAELD